MLIFLTKDHTIDPDAVALAHLIPWNGEPYAQFLMKREDMLPLSFAGDEALEVWAHWTLYVSRAEAEFRGGEE
jgi:hypothetical protein